MVLMRSVLLRLSRGGGGEENKRHCEGVPMVKPQEEREREIWPSQQSSIVCPGPLNKDPKHKPKLDQRMRWLRSAMG